MKKLFIFLSLIGSQITFAQNSFNAIIKDEKTKEDLDGATAFIDKLKVGSTSADNGQLTISNIPNGEFEIEFRSSGYKNKIQNFKFPLPNPEQVIEILLEPESKELGEVVVQSTRSSRSIEDIPTRVDVIASGELDEEASMKPGEIKKLLTEGTGIATQQTSAVSGTANIRIQGLDGRYTQILKDGMPLYNGFSGGLSIMQIAPLDLKQVEFVKGSASTLYGGGAIAGLINLISKTPQEKREFTFLLNGTSAKGFDGSVFYSQKFKKIGTTIFSSYNFNAPYDPANIGLTAIPQTNRFTINPKLFFYLNEKTSAWFGVNTTYEDRYGGDIKVIEGKSDSIHQYFEQNKSLRISTQLSFTHQINSENKINFKNSVGFFDRKLSQPNENFNGQQVSSFSEFNYSHIRERSEWITGLNLWTDNFKSLDTSNLNYKLTTLGGFAQNTFKATEWFSLETGLRIDYNTPATNDKLKGFFILPRVNALFKINQHWTSRIGSGLGYKMPSPFSEEAEQEGYNNIQPISCSNIKAEQSYGSNADVTFKTSIDEITVNVNELFFYTYLNKPLVLQANNFVNANGYIDTKGMETNLKIGIDELNLYFGYTFADVGQHFNGQSLWQPLTAKHRLITDFTYEKENNFRTGIECNYISPQLLLDGTTGKGYFIFGFFFEKSWKHISTYINAENLTDQRQTKWDSIYTGTITNPVFRDIYAPLDGVVVNAGIKIGL
ncbi:MAG: TonB-dependent receptor [Chitinophagaceae bacterium]